MSLIYRINIYESGQIITFSVWFFSSVCCLLLSMLSWCLYDCLFSCWQSVHKPYFYLGFNECICVHACLCMNKCVCECVCLLQYQSMRLSDVHRKSQLWRGIVSISLIEGRSLQPMDANGLSDPYIKFRMGHQKYKTKVNTLLFKNT